MAEDINIEDEALEAQGVVDEGPPPGIVRRRPTETVTGLVLAGAIYGFLAEAGLVNWMAALVAVAIAFVPGLFSYAVDLVRDEDEYGDLTD